jgi:hypothetical protein
MNNEHGGLPLGLKSGRKRAKNTTWLSARVRVRTEVILGLVSNAWG